MKLLYFTDTHIRGNSPKNRTDDFSKSLEKKLYEIKDIVKREKVDYILHGGDLFDRPDVSISISSYFSKILLDMGVPIYMISGNHDVYGHNPQTINRTILGFLDTLGVINLIDRKNYIILKKGGISLLLTGQPYVYDVDNNKDYYYQRHEEILVDYRVHMVHGMLLDRPFIKGIPYTLVDDILDTDVDILLSGHYHAGFNTIEKNGKYFINPGSLVRISNSLSEISRKPRVVIIELKDSINIKDVYLKNIIAGDKVLDRTEIENSMFKGERILEFKQTIDSSINFEKMDMNELIMEVSMATNVDKEVRIEALNRIARTQMKGSLGE